MKIRIEPDQNQINRALLFCKSFPGKLEKALPRATNRALVAGRTQIVKSVAGKYTLKAGKVRRSITLLSASKGKNEGVLIVRGSNLPLREFSHTPRVEATTGDKRRPVKVRELRGGAPELIAKGFKWKGHIFHREDDRKIKKDFRTGIVAKAMETSPDVEERMKEVLAARLDHEIKVILDGTVK